MDELSRRDYKATSANFSSGFGALLSLNII